MSANIRRASRSKKPIESTLYVLVQIGSEFAALPLQLIAGITFWVCCLMLLPMHGVGAILFSPTLPPADLEGLSLTGHLPVIQDIGRLHDTIVALEKGTLVNEDLRTTLMSSWDIGCARPKVVVRDDYGLEWIVKFPRSIDTYSRQRANTI